MNKTTTDPVLPKLRSDIVISEGGLDYNETPTWVIHDKVNNKFYHINWLEHELLKKWVQIPQHDFITRFNASSPAKVDSERLEDFLVFLAKNCLIEQSYELMNAIKEDQEKNLAEKFSLRWWIKNYLFIRVPLVKPDNFLNTILPYTKFVFSIKFAALMAFAAVFALTLLIRDWSRFTSTFFEVFSTQYLIVFLIAITIAKILHEFGHALACKKNGLPVPAMGVAFLVMFPMLYTDTSHSWTVKNPRDRLLISTAGVLMELYLAIIALWFWLILPIGMLKSICFFMATYSLLASIIINVSPFLRFDGYHVLSDIMKMRNLQTRAFAITRCWLRKVILGIDEPYPEKFKQRKMVFLITYSILAWIYRFFLFIGIAIIVYTMFFKALGILLFVVEIYYFICKPIFRELGICWEKREKFSINMYSSVVALVVFTLSFLFFYPWRAEVILPATFEFKNITYYLETPAKATEVNLKNGDSVEKGAHLASFSSPRLEHLIRKNRLAIQEIHHRLRNIGTLNADLSEKKVMQSELARHREERQFLRKKLEKMQVTAPFTGTVSSVLPGLNTGRWVAKKQALFVLTSDDIYGVKAFADIDEKSLSETGNKAEFIPDNLELPKLNLAVKSIDFQQAEQIKIDQHSRGREHMTTDNPPIAYHLSVNGGSIAVRDTPEGYQPEESIYTITLDVTEPLPSTYRQTVTGVVVLKGARESYAYTTYKHIVSLLIREMSF